MKLKFKFKFIASLVLILPFLFMASSCEELLADLDDEDVEQVYENLGWWGMEDEDTESIEDGISFGSGDLPSKVDISGNMPPVGNQGQYGTCVAWAVGYGHKTYMEAVENNRTTADLSNTAYQFSPKYLFWAIPSGSKNDDCNGTGFQPAYDVMLSKGIAQESVVPYTDLGDCSGSTTSAWDNNADDYLIENYREIDVDKATIKQYLAQGRAVVFGAKLGDDFMNWNSSSILYSDTYGYSGQHAYHAMILTGYDDSKGTNGAFRVLNSWGTGWGDNGYIWVDQNFFVGSGGDFAFCAFVAQNAANTAPDLDDPEDGMDVMAWELSDELNVDNPDPDGRNRTARYDVYNSGNEPILASEDWNILYVYYNAYDANDYGIILYDYYSDDYADQANGMPDNWSLDSDGDGVGNWYNYVDVPASQSVAQALYDDPDARFRWDYTMPEITGEYYLVIIADGYDVLKEVNEENNYFYLTDTNGEPIQITNGVIQDPLMDNSKSGVVPPKKFGPSEKPTVRTEKNLNAYTTKEITAMIKNRKETGDIQRKAMQYVNKNSYPKKVEKR
jgi:hypothetical protein